MIDKEVDIKKKGLFSKIEKFLLLRGLLNDLPIKYIKKAIVIFFVGILYIANSHFYDRAVRAINRLEEDVERLRVDYTIMKADYMFDSKRLEVARRLQPCSIEISDCPPFVIEDE